MANTSGKPWVFSSFQLVGRRLNEADWLSQQTVVPAKIGPTPPPGVRRHELPLLTDIVVFP